MNKKIIKSKPSKPYNYEGIRKISESTQLTLKHCTMLINAAQKTIDNNQPFNRFITISWEKGGVDARQNAKATRRFIKKAYDWIGHYGHRLTWAWVQEYGAKNGAHVHILLHVPDEIDSLFSVMPLKWVKNILPGAYIAKTLRSQIIYHNQSQKHLVDIYESVLWEKVHYMLKCAPQVLEARLDMEGQGNAQWGQSGMVYGKRLAIWQEHKR